MTSTNQTAQPGNELFFTRGTKRFQRIGDTLRVVTEGATVEITLGSDGITRVKVAVTAPNVVVRQSTRKAARATENKPEGTEPQATAPAAAKPQSAANGMKPMRGAAK